MDDLKEVSEEKKNEAKKEGGKMSTFVSWCLLASLPLSIFGISVYLYGFKQVMTAVLSVVILGGVFCLLICFPGSCSSHDYAGCDEGGDDE